METKLYRSSTDSRIAGVCGGLAEYFGVDPTLVRAIFVAMGLVGGLGVVLYVVLWITIPRGAQSAGVDGMTAPIIDGGV